MYYRLTYKSSTDKHLTGDTVLNSLRPLDIGQTPSCDVRLPENSELEPVVFATIQPVEGGWALVRRTDCYTILVNGESLTVARRLSDKDEIQLSDGQNETVLRFNVFTDGEYDSASGLVYSRHTASHRLLPACIVLAFVAVGVACYAVLGGRHKDLRHSIPETYAKALYHITVDSVSLLHDTIIDGRRQQVVVESVELQQAAVGTCFVTDNGLLVTARHCLEPWLDDDTWNGQAIDPKMAPDVRLAVIAETRNQLSGSEDYTVRSHCVVSLGGFAREFYSTDFHIDKSRDMILELGTDRQPLYWRTIFPMAHRRDMELGDFAYMKAPSGMGKSSLPVASLAELKAFGSPEGDHDIAVMGYPVNDNDADDNVKTDFGNSQPLELDSASRFIGCMQMTAPINRGNSGGPVLALIGGKVKVVGIVSKADRKAEQQTFWAVPITEVLRMHADGDRVKYNETTFRR